MYFEAHLKLCLAAVSALRIFRDRYHGLVVQFLTVSGKLDRFSYPKEHTQRFFTISEGFFNQKY